MATATASKESFKTKLVDRFISISAAIGRQRHLAAIKDGFIAIMPLMILGSIFLLINNIPLSNDPAAEIPNVGAWLSNISWLKWFPPLAGHVVDSTFSIMALFAIAAIGYNLAKGMDGNALGAAVCSVASYVAVIPGGDALNLHFGATSLFMGIIISLVAAEIFVRLSRSKKIMIKMPASVPPAVSKSFAALLPTMITITIIAFVGNFLETYFDTNMLLWFGANLFSKLQGVSGSYFFGLFIVVFVSLFWIVGLHGANMFSGILEAMNLPALQGNLDYINGVEGAKMTIFNNGFLNTFVYMGGSGVGIAIVIAVLIASRSKSSRMIGKMSVAPGLFNINEPVLFGLPIVLNPVFLVPFVLGPVACLTIAYIATAVGFVPPVAYVAPWTTPPILSGLFATGFAWQAPVIQVINIAVSVLIYMPFIKLADTIEKKKEDLAKAEALNSIPATAGAGASVKAPIFGSNIKEDVKEEVEETVER